ncbi:hypothetical protein L0337_22465 [candidate division KSB1 bacterium]|nr:hypothetical protein [candidate division KSB1 bacterium]
MKKILLKASIFALAVTLIAVSGSLVYSTTMVKRNLADLTKMAEVIFVGKMIGASDGLLNGRLPYTEYTFEVLESLKGDLPATQGPFGARSTYRYRQLGLLKPRDMGNGKTLALTGKNIGGLPLYKNGETALVFLGKPSPQTGLRTTVGLMQGKFMIENGRAANAINNAGLFEGMNVPQSGTKLSNAEKAMMSQKAGAVDAKTLIETVKRAVKDQIFE